MFTGKTALVTGAASGIGLATAHHLALQGATRLILCDRNADALSDAAARIDGPRLTLHTGDVSTEEHWRRLDAIVDDVDLAVLNAGVSSAGAIADLDFGEWRRLMSINLDAAFLGLRTTLRAMRAHGRGGSILLTASASGFKAEVGIAAYGASKAGVIQLARVAAKEGAPDAIRVNAIAPGGVETPIWRDVPFFQDLVAEKGSEAAAFARMGRIATPLGRYASADEIAQQICFLLSDACRTVTGAVFVSDGGYTL